LQHPNDAVAFFEFEEKFGKTWVLPPEIWFRSGGFSLGETFEFTDVYGKMHRLEIGPQRRTKDGDIITYLNIDYHSEPFLTEMSNEFEGTKRKVTLSPKEILDLAKKGDIRSHIMGNVNEIKVNEGDTVVQGQVLMVLEAMKMLNNILSPVDGKVSQILVSAGSKIEIGDGLTVIQVE
jgi:pyruvate carboxylase